MAPVPQQASTSAPEAHQPTVVWTPLRAHGPFQYVDRAGFAYPRRTTGRATKPGRRPTGCTAELTIPRYLVGHRTHAGIGRRQCASRSYAAASRTTRLHRSKVARSRAELSLSVSSSTPPMPSPTQQGGRWSSPAGQGRAGRQELPTARVAAIPRRHHEDAWRVQPRRAIPSQVDNCPRPAALVHGGVQRLVQRDATCPGAPNGGWRVIGPPTRCAMRGGIIGDVATRARLRVAETVAAPAGSPP